MSEPSAYYPHNVLLDDVIPTSCPPVDSLVTLGDALDEEATSHKGFPDDSAAGYRRLEAKFGQ